MFDTLFFIVVGIIVFVSLVRNAVNKSGDLPKDHNAHQAHHENNQSESMSGMPETYRRDDPYSILFDVSNSTE